MFVVTATLVPPQNVKDPPRTPRAATKAALVAVVFTEKQRDALSAAGGGRPTRKECYSRCMARRNAQVLCQVDCGCQKGSHCNWPEEVVLQPAPVGYDKDWPKAEAEVGPFPVPRARLVRCHTC